MMYLDLQLAGDSEVGLLFKKILSVVQITVLQVRHFVDFSIFEKCRDLEHLSSAFTVASRDDGGVDIEAPIALEEHVRGVGKVVPYTSDCAEEVSTRTKMRDGSEGFDLLKALGHGVLFGISGAHNDNVMSIGVVDSHFDELTGGRALYNQACGFNGEASVCLGQLSKVAGVGIDYDLKCGRASAIIDLNED